MYAVLLHDGLSSLMSPTARDASIAESAIVRKLSSADEAAAAVKLMDSTSIL